MIVSWAPFTRLGISSGQYHIRKLAAIAPLAAGAAYCFGSGFLARLAVMAAAAAVLRLALARRRAPGIGWGHDFYEAALLSLLAPAALSWWMAWICPALAFLLRRVLGGRDGVVPVNVPAAVLSALLVHFGVGGVALERWPAPPWFGPAASQYFLCGALPAGISALAMFSLLSRHYKFRLLAGFSLPAIILSALLSYNPWGGGAALSEQLLALNALVVAAVFLAADEASTPRAGWAQALQGLLAALVFLPFSTRGMLYQAVVWSAFIPSLFSPWLDAASAYRSWLPRFPSGIGIHE